MKKIIRNTIRFVYNCEGVNFSTINLDYRILLIILSFQIKKE